MPILGWTSFRTAVSGFVLVCSLALCGLAQGGGMASPSDPRSVADPFSKMEQREIIVRGMPGEPEPKKGQESACFLPPLTGAHNLTVGITTLEVQGKATKDYEKACDALREGKFDEAEKRLHEAVGKYPQYSTLWVLLGQVLERRQELQLARDACLQASKANSTSVPSYLCLADIAAREQNWKDVLQLSNHALELDPSTNPVSYLYQATANFNLHSLDEAEKGVLRGMDIDKTHPNPRMNYLLAQIYGAKGDRTNEMIQLRQFLKLADGTPAAESVKQYLSKLEGASLINPAAAQPVPPAK
jgi:tetratricopeptide (TPR) repeat protein